MTAIQSAQNHNYDGHDIFQSCGFDEDRQSGEVNLTGEVREVPGAHGDQIAVRDARCFILKDSTLLVDMALRDEEQNACAPIAAEVVEQITGQECNISPLQ